MIYLEKNNLDELIDKDLCLVEFFAKWCNPCKAYDNILLELDKEVKIIKIDTDLFPKIVFKYRIMSIPTIIVFKDGKNIKELVGIHSKEEILEEIKNS